MEPPAQPREKNRSGASPLLFYIILAIIVAAIAAFLILRPHPSNASITYPNGPPASQTLLSLAGSAAVA